MSEKKKDKKVDLNDYVLIPKNVKLTIPSVPEILKGWDDKNPPSEECIEISKTFDSIIKYIAEQLNTGPEFKDSIQKRGNTLKAVLKVLSTSTFLDTYHKIGIFMELVNELFFEAKLKQIALTTIKEAENKESQSPRYVA